jgi:hypothetical protein
LARWVTLVQVVGYTTSLVYVWHTTHLAPAGIVTRYRGGEPTETAGPMTFAKSFSEMLTLTHTHVLAMVVIFALSGLGLALAEWPDERWKRILIVEPFVALLISFSAMWLMRYVDPRFSWLLAASSTVMAATFYLQSAAILVDLHRAERLAT